MLEGLVMCFRVGKYTASSGRDWPSSRGFPNRLQENPAAIPSHSMVRNMRSSFSLSLPAMPKGSVSGTPLTIRLHVRSWASSRSRYLCWLLTMSVSRLTSLRSCFRFHPFKALFYLFSSSKVSSCLALNLASIRIR